MSDCRRNSISGMAQANFRQSILTGRKGHEMLQMLKEKNIDWYSSPNWYRFGTLIKKRKIEKEAINQLTREAVTVLRTETVHASASIIESFSPERVQLVMAKSLTKEEFPGVYDIFSTGDVAD